MALAGCGGVGGTSPQPPPRPPDATASPAGLRAGGAAHPPYPVAETTFHLVDRSRPTISRGHLISANRALTTEVWVPRAAGRLPLVVFAPGFDAGPGDYGALLGAWAAHGYVVAAPEFPLTDPAVAGGALDEADIDNQPADVRFVADWLVGPSSPLAARLDPARVAVAGHSDGGETVLAAALAPAPPGEPVFRAVIAMSAQPVPGDPGPYPPLLVTQGDADTVNPPALGRRLYDSAGPPRYLLVLHGGGHLPPLQAGSAWLPGIEAVTEAFLDAYAARTAPAAALAAAAAGDPLLALTADP